jgi:hypothetical protein
MRFMVYQRRMTVDFMKTKALLMAALNPEQAERSAREYTEMAVPIGPDALDEQLKAREREIAELDTMEPIRMGQVKTGPAMEGTKEWGTATSMRKR